MIYEVWWKGPRVQGSGGAGHPRGPSLDGTLSPRSYHTSCSPGAGPGGASQTPHCFVLQRDPHLLGLLGLPGVKRAVNASWEARSLSSCSSAVLKILLPASPWPALTFPVVRTL